jgi:hypothetical protein
MTISTGTSRAGSICMTIFIQKAEVHACHALPHMKSPTACHLRLKIQFQKETRFLLILKKDEVLYKLVYTFFLRHRNSATPPLPGQILPII